MKICLDCKHCITPPEWSREKELLSDNYDELAKCALYIEVPSRIEVHLVTGDSETIGPKLGCCFDNRYNGECGKLGNYYEPIGDVEIPTEE